ncbi:MAG: Dam family site-specific DNA-(adenine-N6)-methyltransferase [Candidatus Melainabacteria bacterium]|nr:Dam family site-specific DNA-(adenine-N6)-methyltransferase [Candidatus Melainabacteria bacterium]
MPKATVGCRLVRSDGASSGSSLLLPPLKWAGGKRWLVPILQKVWQPYAPQVRLVEPFCGGLAVALGLQPQCALLNDANPHLMNFYRHLQQGLAITECFQNDRAYYLAARARFNQLIAAQQAHTPEAAQWFYYLNRTGYNGLCRFNRGGFFNVPFGRYAHISYASGFEAYQAALLRWAFSVGDFESLRLQSDDFVYADPPYDVPFVSYAQDGFSWEAQVRLAHWLANHSGPVVVSNQATERVLALYQSHGFHIQCLPAPRRIACNGNRTPALEMLASKNLPPNALSLSPANAP